MRILHLPLWTPNKSDIQLGNFIQHHISLSGKAHEIHTLEFFSDGSARNINVSSTKRLTSISYPKSRFKLIAFLWYLKAVRLSLRHLKKIDFDPDIIHCHVAGRNLWMANRFFARVPKILSEHWSGYVNGNFDKQSFIVKRHMIQQINKCDVVTSVSDHLSQSMYEKGVNNGIVKLQNVIRFKEKLELSSQVEMSFLMVADLVDEVKNVSGVIEAMNQLTKDYPFFKLVIIGDGPDMEILKNKACNLEDHIHFVGRLAQDKVQDFLVKADCLIVNSNHETYSMITIESILTGCPVIATRCGGPEQFVNAENGILIPKSNLDGLKQAMKDLHRNRMNYEPQKVRNSVQGDYSESSLEAKLNSIYSRFI